MTLNKDNLLSKFEILIVGNIRAQNYNEECFGSKEVQRARPMSFVVDEVLERLSNMGYNPNSILGDVLVKYGYTLQEPCKGEEELRDDFSMDVSEFGQAVNFVKNVFEQTKVLIEDGQMPRR